MGQYSSYYLYQKYEKRGDQPFVPVYPAVYSVDGDGTREPVTKNENDYQCGWTGETGTLYRWVDLPIDTDYICDECPEVQYRWVETGEYRCEYSPDTPDAQYRWVNIPINEDYMCSGTSKYYKEVYQVSTDGGSTWNDVVPAQYRMGDLYEADSSDCESERYSDQYFTIESLVDNNVVRFGSSSVMSISASTDGGSTWTEYASSGNDNFTIATLNAGQKVFVKGLNSRYVVVTSHGTIGYVNNFDTSGNYKVYGNIMSLVYGDSFATATTLTGDHNFDGFFGGDNKLISAANLVLPATVLTEYCYIGMFRFCSNLTAAPQLPATTLAESCYSNMFNGCTSLTTAPELPATTLAHSCYGFMFNGCTSLTTAPELPATTLVSSCYNSMFKGCTSLVNAPELPATTLTEYCYDYMFSGCTSLTTAPELPATTLVDACYANMFDGCTRLNYIKAMFTTTPYATYTNNWVRGVASSGTFVKNTAATWTKTGVDGIPSGWTVQNA